MAGRFVFSARNVDARREIRVSVAPAVATLKLQSQTTAAGLSEELATKIFDPYFTTKPTGSGLGLSISYSIVKKHGGMLHLENSSREGSTFAFYLPAADGELPIARAGGYRSVLSSFTHQRVLVMDDEAAIRDLTSELLGTLGYEVTAVPDGIEAVKTYELLCAAARIFRPSFSTRPFAEEWAVWRRLSACAVSIPM